MLNIIGRKNTFLTISGFFVCAAIIVIIAFGFREGIDFQGGTLWSFRGGTTGTPGTSEFEQFFSGELGMKDVRVTEDTTNHTLLAKLPPVAEATRQEYAAKIAAKFPGLQEDSFQSIGPSVGAELRQKSLIAIVLVLIGISLYIAFAFRKVFRPVSSWKYGVVTLISLFHDVVIPAGLLAILGRYGQVEIDGNFIVALLVIMGFSVHDTIVVFDRIRENLVLDRGKSPFTKVVNDSVNQTLARSVNTSLTLILVLIALFIAGPVHLKYFILTLIVGVTVGIYSSIFVASPLLIVWQEWSRRTGKGA